MERNLVIAGLLTVIITIAWVMLVPKPSQQTPSVTAPPVPTQGVPVEQGAEQVKGPTKAPAAIGEIDLEKESAAARDVTVETPLVEATFTTLGARIKSLKLKKYPYKSGGLVDIIPHEENLETELPLAMTLHDEVGGDLPNKLNFAAVQEGYTVGFERELPNGLFITKECRFRPDNYDVEFAVGVENRGSTAVYVGEDEKPSYLLWWGPGVEKLQSGQYNETLLTAINSGKLLQKKESGVKSLETFRQLSWAGLKNRYFFAAVVPVESPAIGRVLPMGPSEIAVEILASSFRLDGGTSKQNKYVVYAGPQDIQLLKKAGYELDRAVNYGWLDWLSKIMLEILKFCYRVIPNYGIGIILLTVIVRMVTYPLTYKSMQSMKKMQELGPELQKLREKYKDNPQELNKRTMQFYKERGVNPMGGCLPMLLQMPIWFALYGVYRGAIELRGAPFFWWIDDLSEPDTIAQLPFQLPFLGDQVHALPLLAAGAMFLQQKMTSPAGTTTAQAEQQRIMMFIFPIMFGFLFYNMPSGLCLYIVVSSLLYFGQQAGTGKSRFLRRKEKPASQK